MASDIERAVHAVLADVAAREEIARQADQYRTASVERMTAAVRDAALGGGFSS